MMFYPCDIYEDSVPDFKYDFHSYRIYLFGTLFDGKLYKNTVLRINGIHPFFDIRVPTAARQNDETVRIRSTIVNECGKNGHDLETEEKRLRAPSIEIIHGMGIEKYKDDADFIRLTFLSHMRRKKFIKLFRGMGYQTAYDDMTCYHRLVARNASISFSNLMIIDPTKMKVDKVDKYIKADVLGEGQVKNAMAGTSSILQEAQNLARPLMVQCPFDALSIYKGDIIKNPLLRDDHSLVASWDIETVDSRAGVVPLPKYDQSDIFSIATLYAEAWSPVYSKLLKDREIGPNNRKYSYPKLSGYKRMQVISIFKIPKHLQSPNREYVFVENEKEMLLTWAKTMGEMFPHIWIDCNGTEYDITWLFERAKKHGIYREVVKYLSKIDLDFYEKSKQQQIKYDQYYQEYKVKLEAGKDTKGKALIIPGLIYNDIQISMRVLHMNPAYYSLNYFLIKKYGRNGKVDMDHKLMHNLINFAMLLRENGYYNLASEELRQRLLCMILGEKAAFNFEKAMAYCFEYNMIDSVKTFDLFKLSNLLVDKREMGTISYTSLNDCFMRANGMKVRNKILALAHQRHFHISNIPAKLVESSEKYTGAFVFFPKRVTRKPKLTFRQFLTKWCKLNNAATTDLSYFHALIKKCGITIDTYPKDIIDGLVNEAKSIVESPDMFTRINRFRENPRLIDDLQATEDDLRYLANLPLNTCSDTAFSYYMVYAFLVWLTVPNYLPIAAIDANSLYPSIILVLNLSPEMLITDPKVAESLVLAGEKIEPLTFTYANRRRTVWFKRHKLYDPDGEIERDRKIAAGADPKETKAVAADFTDPQYEFGMYPTILKELGNVRAKIKKELSAFKKEKEIIEGKDAEAFAKLKDRYDEVCLNYEYLDAKQRAVKVYMNTFYGECGNQHSALRRIEIAMGITTNGQNRIKMVKAEVENKFGYEVVYGDTDSNYLRPMRKEEVREYDVAYYTEQITVQQYAEKVVLLAMKNIELLKQHIDKLMLEVNGNPFLKFGYEEVLYPCAFFIKKKYGGVAHTSIYNANPKDLFLRGTENSANKRDAPKYMKDILDAVMKRMFSLTETSTTTEIVEEEIKKVYATEINFEHYIKSDEFRPLKQNVKVQNFVKRMNKSLEEWNLAHPGMVAPADVARPPAPGERFKYVIVEKKPEFDSRGRLCSKSASFKMEYPEVAKAKGYKIDLNYYMSKNVLAQLAMITMYKFDKQGTIPTDESEKAVNLASRQYIAGIYRQYSPDVIPLTPIYQEVTKVIARCLDAVMNINDLYPKKTTPSITPYDLLMLDIEREKKYDEAKAEVLNTVVKPFADKVKKIRGSNDRSITRDDLLGLIMTRIEKCASVGLTPEVKTLRKSMPYMSDTEVAQILAQQLTIYRNLDVYQTAQVSKQINELCTPLFNMIKIKNTWFREITKHVDVNTTGGTATNQKDIKIIAPYLVKKLNEVEIIKYLRGQIKFLDFSILTHLFIHVNLVMITRRKMKIYEKAYQNLLKIKVSGLSSAEIGAEMQKL